MEIKQIMKGNLILVPYAYMKQQNPEEDVALITNLEAGFEQTLKYIMVGNTIKRRIWKR